MKKTRFFAVIAMGVMAFSLTACSLARTEDGSGTQGDDQLIGVLITTEYLDLFDLEGYLEDHPGQLSQGGEIAVEHGDAYENRLYATQTTRTLTREDTGETEEIEEYVFEGTQGWAYLAPAMLDQADNRIGTSSSVDDAISDTGMHVTTTDEGEMLELEATLYVTGVETGQSYYINPVFQTADGAVYALGGDGMLVSQEAEQEGEYWSYTLDHSTTTQMNGQTETHQVSVLIHLSVLYQPMEITLVQMDGENGVLSQQVYQPGGLPETLETEPGCAYLLVETRKQDPTGAEVVSRQLVSPGEDSFRTFYARQDGVCLGQWTQLQWN